ncbi:MAG: hypothetical protein ABR969_02515 [Sedimentisphaerales bacterium]
MTANQHPTKVQSGSSAGQAKWAAGLLALLALAIYSPAILGGKTLLLRDIHTQFYGMRWWYAESLATGQLPQWNSYILGGTPFLANPQTSVFYPLSTIFLVFSPAYGLAVHTAVHCALLGFFCYLLGRNLGLSFWPALLAGIAAGFAGIPMKQIEFPEELAGLAWTPCVLLGIRLCLWQPSRRASAILGAAIGMQLLAGSPYPPFYAMLGMFCCVFVFAGQNYFCKRTLSASATDIPRATAAAALGVLIGILLGCAQYVPTLWLIRNTTPDVLSGVMHPMFSLRLRDVLHFISPWVAGYPNWQKCFYLGVAPLFLAVVAVIVSFAPKAGRCDKKSQQQSSQRFPFFEGFLLCALWIAVGWIFSQAGYLGLDKIIAKLPLLTRIAKWPTLGMSLVILGLALLAGTGADQLFNSGRPVSRRKLLAILAVVSLCISAALLDSVRGVWMSWLREYLKEEIVGFASAALKMENYPLRAEIFRLSLFSAALGLILVLGTRNRFLRLAIPALCLLTAMDLMTAWQGLNFYSPVNIYQEKPRVLRQAAEDPHALVLNRFISKDNPLLNDVIYGSRSLEEFRFIREMFIGNIAMNFRAYTLNGVASVKLDEYNDLLSVLDDLTTWDTPDADRILGAWNVQYIVEGFWGADSQFHYGLRRNTEVLPRARLVEKVEMLHNQTEVLEKIAGTQWDTTAALVTPQQLTLAKAAEKFSNTGALPGTISSIVYSPNRVDVICDANKPCILVLAENWAQGWSARMDGSPAELYRVNFLQQAVQLPVGKHQIEFHYSTPGLGVGLLLGGLGLFACVICAFSKVKRPVAGEVISTYKKM